MTLPILYEDHQTVVFTNGSGEIFVKLKNGNGQIRVSPKRDGLTVTASGFLIQPYSVNGLPAFEVSKR